MEQGQFLYSDSNKRYHTLDYHLKHKFGCKVFKLSIHGGFTCPNLDGTKGYGGCTYCSGMGSGDFAGNPLHTVTEQLEEVRQRMHCKWSEGKYIAYFQAFTNTYAPVERLKQLYEEALQFENVVGLFVATRADSISDQVLDYLEELSTRTYLVVELGLQSAFDQTGEHIHRGHTFAEFTEMVKKLQKRGIHVGVHIINGLPNETSKMMVETVKKIVPLGLHNIKIHLLHIIQGTQMAQEYQQGGFSLMSREEYVKVVCDQLELLPPEMIIQRLTGDGERDTLIGPLWSIKKLVVLNEIDKELKRRESFQGCRYTGE